MWLFQHFGLPTPGLGNWFASINLQDAYFHIHIFPQRKILIPVSDDPIRAPPCPKGLHQMCRSGSDPMTQCGHQKCCLYRRLPDLFSLTGTCSFKHHYSGRSPFQAWFQTQSGQEPSRPIPGEYLGLRLDSLSYWARLSERRVASFRHCPALSCEGRMVSIRTCLGLMASTLSVIPMGRLRMRSRLGHCAKGKGCERHLVSPT